MFGIGETVGGLFATGLASQANKNAKKAARRAYERSVKAYQSRFQWSMEDMRKAGLNPILAAQGGLGGPGAGVSAPTAQVFSAQDAVQRAGSAVGKAALAGYTKKLEKKLLEEQVKLTDANRMAQIASSSKDLALGQKVDTENMIRETELEMARGTLDWYRRNPDAYSARAMKGTGTNPFNQLMNILGGIIYDVAPDANSAKGNK